MPLIFFKDNLVVKISSKCKRQLFLGNHYVGRAFECTSSRLWAVIMVGENDYLQAVDGYNAVSRSLLPFLHEIEK